MKAGLMRYFITIWRWTNEQTDSGQQRKTKQTIHECRAYMYSQSGKESDQADELFNYSTLVFQIRWAGEITIKTTDIIEWEGNNYKITFIEQNPYNRELKITCSLINE